MQHGKLKINEEVLYSNKRKILGMKLFVFKIVLDATIF